MKYEDLHNLAYGVLWIVFWKPIGTAEDIFKEIEKKLNNDKTFTKSHIVLLSHDEMFRYQYEESELKKLIDLLKSKDGYKISQLKDYP
jgi:hypothetical protein